MTSRVLRKRCTILSDTFKEKRAKKKNCAHAEAIDDDANDVNDQVNAANLTSVTVQSSRVGRKKIKNVPNSYKGILGKQQITVADKVKAIKYISPASKLAARKNKDETRSVYDNCTGSDDENESKYFRKDVLVGSCKGRRGRSFEGSRDGVDVAGKRAVRSRSTAAGSKRAKRETAKRCEQLAVKNGAKPVKVTKRKRGKSRPKQESNDGGAGKLDELTVSAEQEAEHGPISLEKEGPLAATDSQWKTSEQSDSECDWEEVEELEPIVEKCQIPKAPIEIVIEGPDIMKRKKRNRIDPATEFRRMMNRFRKATQLDLHKVHLLCLISHGFHRNSMCNKEELCCVALSLVPADFLSSGWDVGRLADVTDWFRREFTTRPPSSDGHGTSDMLDILIVGLQNRAVASDAELVFLFVCMLRAVGLSVRLIYSLQPVSYKATDLLLTQGQRYTAAMKCVVRARRELTAKTSTTATSSGGADTSASSEDKPARKVLASAGISAAAAGTKAAPAVTSSKLAKQGTDEDESDFSDGKAVKSTEKVNCRRPRACRAKVSYTEMKEMDIDDSTQDTREPPGGKTAQQGKRCRGKRLAAGGGQDEWKEAQESNGVDDRHVHSQQKSKKRQQRKLAGKTATDGTDYWAEVYIGNSWICVDCVRNRVSHPEEMETVASTPLSYVLAFDNKGVVKDMTRRYAHDWLSHTQRLRGDAEWWDETLQPYRAKSADGDENEDVLLQAQLLDRPLPVSISGFKSHPLYALKRHLLKFEAIYPNSAVPLGFIKNEPVYARECVRNLHSRETWLKEGLVVKLGEEPYKVVKARPKWGRQNVQPPSDVPSLPIFGEWQTEVYVPPPAVDGKVPRNAYGNVELFKPSMLPAGTVHLRLSGLIKVAKKLDIDCAAAMVGWDFHSGFNHPVMDGWIVCEEHSEILCAAWAEEQEIQREKRAKEREQKTIDNWKLLTKALLIKERLKARYKLSDVEPPVISKAQKATAKKCTETETKPNDVALAWPRNKKKSSTEVKKNNNLLRPFEMEQF